MTDINFKEAPLSSEQMVTKKNLFEKLVYLPFLTLMLSFTLLIWFLSSLPETTMKVYIFIVVSVFAIVLMQILSNWNTYLKNNLKNYTELDINRDMMEIKEFLHFSHQNEVVKNYLRQLRKLNRLPTHGEYEMALHEYNTDQSFLLKEEDIKKKQAILNELGFSKEVIGTLKSQKTRRVR